MIQLSVYRFSILKLTEFFVKLLLIIMTVSHLLANTAWAAGGDYVVGAGDVVKINVFDYPDLSTETRVSESGRITLPLLGEVIIGGKSPAEAEILIAGELSKAGLCPPAARDLGC